MNDNQQMPQASSESAATAFDRQKFDAEWRRLSDQMRSQQIFTRARAGAFRDWVRDTWGALTDLKFQHSVTESLLTAVYVLGLVFAVGLPLLGVIALWMWQPLIALFVLVTLAPLVALCLAATVRVAIEFILATQKLSDQVGSISEVAGDLHRNVNVPLARVTDSIKTVRSWRPRAGS